MWLISAFTLIGVAFFIYDDYTSRDWREYCAKERKDNDRMQKEAECKKCEDIIAKELCANYKEIQSIEFQGYSVMPANRVKFIVIVKTAKLNKMSYTLDASTLKVTTVGLHNTYSSVEPNRGSTNVDNVLIKYSYETIDMKGK